MDNQQATPKYFEFNQDDECNIPLECFLDGYFNGTAYGVDYLNSATNKVYRTSNELLDSIFKNFDINGKNVLTVGSSGDQIFYSLLSGAKKVRFVDADIYAVPFIEYKKALIKNLTFLHH